MDVNHAFTDTGFRDIGTGMALFQALQVGPIDLQEPATVQKLKDIAEFLNDHPDPLLAISTLNRKAKGTSEQRLNHVWSWSTLSKQERKLNQELEKVRKEISYYG